jgi:sugar lactone lactonase YvrE
MSGESKDRQDDDKIFLNNNNVFETIVHPEDSFKVSLVGNNIHVIRESDSASQYNEQLRRHWAVLESVGITPKNIDSLGRMAISGNVVPKDGVTRPDPNDPENIYEPTTIQFQEAYKIRTDQVPIAEETTIESSASTISFERISGTARLLKATSSPTLAVDIAYWAASEIDIPDNTNVILSKPRKYIVIITPKLTVGKNVTFTWERPQLKVPERPETPPAKPRAPQGDRLFGTPGDKGEDGIGGNRGPNGNDAPELEVWVLQMSGNPAFDLRGQDGSQGGTGGNGGQGGDGSFGLDAELDAFGFCAKGPGRGGTGGAGGRAGNGGRSGDGGKGGSLAIYAPQPVLTAYQRSFFVSVNGGNAGPGGQPGQPGRGGYGGPKGRNPKNCQPDRPDGADGYQGGSGDVGQQGNPGLNGTITMIPITELDIESKPAIVRISPNQAKEGDIINVKGLRFKRIDKVMLEGDITCETTYLSDTLLNFVVPKAEGGRRAVWVRSQDNGAGTNTLDSNRETLQVMPHIASAEPAEGVRHGSKVTLRGSGFASNAIVRATNNNQDMPNVQFIDSSKLEFTMMRPSSVEENASGEKVQVKIILQEGESSNEFTIVLKTFVMLVMGDSYAWGQGLLEHEKFHSIIQAEIQKGLGNMGVYKDVQAHSGGTIGIVEETGEEDKTVCSPSKLPGEVPTSYPTCFQQMNNYSLTSPEKVDLVLLTAGINDVDVVRILNPLYHGLEKLIELHCHENMKRLLQKITQESNFKNAKIVVTSWFPFVSKKTDLIGTNILGILIAALLSIAMRDLVAAVGTLEKLKTILVNRCHLFFSNSNSAIQRAIDEVNQDLDATRIAFAPVTNFTDDNAVFAPDPWIFGLKANLDPYDPVASSRAKDCDFGRPISCFDVDGFICPRASMGHANPKGAQQIAESIKLQLPWVLGLESEPKKIPLPRVEVDPNLLTPTPVLQLVKKWGLSGAGDAQFNRPSGIAVDSSGNVYVADTGNYRIQKFTSDGTFIKGWGKEGPNNNEFKLLYQSYIDVDSSGNVYVADTENYRIQKFTSDGDFITKWGTWGYDDGQFRGPQGIVVDNLAHVYVVDSGNYCIQKFTSDGTFIKKWGEYGSGNSQFHFARDVAIDTSAHVYVVDSGNNRIQKFTSDGTFIKEWGKKGNNDGEFNRPEGIAVDSSGNVYVADTRNNRIQKFTSDGDFITKWGTEGSADDQLHLPYGIDVDSSGKIYVADTWKDRILVLASKSTDTPQKKPWDTDTDISTTPAKGEKESMPNG